MALNRVIHAEAGNKIQLHFEDPSLTGSVTPKWPGAARSTLVVIGNAVAYFKRHGRRKPLPSIKVMHELPCACGYAKPPSR
ncbi:Unknown protein sequence [Pseudomonas syringae pv. spinaceae]|uniref:Uncharacterized protein n=1 Tax=Pseudomonas syringae pv. spinaceae TaxID=264459 RepID=A0A0Q0F7T8_PSESX|nr:Unknown protein sequence [Pseudomonas syringae pv. spinaceae]